MSTGVFSSLSRSYRSAARNTFRYVRQTFWLFWPIALIIAIIYAIVLLPISGVFAALIIFDWIGYVTDKIRRSLLKLMKDQSDSVVKSFWSFLFRPILLVLLSPLFFLSLLIPKLSSNTDDISDVAGRAVAVSVSGAGLFKRINQITWDTIKNLFAYVSDEAPLLLKPIVAVIAIMYASVLIVVGVIFTILIPLDWIGWLIERTRSGIASFANRRQENISYGAGAFLFIPVMLALLSPIFLMIILIPKFSTNVDPEV